VRFHHLLSWGRTRNLDWGPSRPRSRAVAVRSKEKVRRFDRKRSCIEPPRWGLEVWRVSQAQKSHVRARRGLANAPLVLLAALGFGSRQNDPNHGQGDVRPLGPIVARCPIVFRSIIGVRPLLNGFVLVSDNKLGEVVLLDSTLQHATVVLDTSSSPAHRYLMPQTMPAGPGRAEGITLSLTGNGLLVPLAGDTTLFLDRFSGVYVVLDPAGRIARVAAVPQPAPIEGFGGSTPGGRGPGFTPRGELIFMRAAPLRSAPPPGSSPMLRMLSPKADSAPLSRVNSRLGTIDTVAWLRVPVDFYPPRVNPFPTTDDWTVLQDGTIAIIRGHDFHVDWIAPGSMTMTSTPRIVFPWRRLSDSVKALIDDSAHAYFVAHPRQQQSLLGTPGDINSLYEVAEYIPDVVPDSVLPSYVPAFSGYTALSGLDDRVWIRVLLSGRPDFAVGQLRQVEMGRARDPAVYYVIDRRGGVVDRVALPGATELRAVGRGSAYLVSREGTGLQLARARLR